MATPTLRVFDAELAHRSQSNPDQVLLGIVRRSWPAKGTMADEGMADKCRERQRTSGPPANPPSAWPPSGADERAPRQAWRKHLAQRISFGPCQLIGLAPLRQGFQAPGGFFRGWIEPTAERICSLSGVSRK